MQDVSLILLFFDTLIYVSLSKLLMEKYLRVLNIFCLVSTFYQIILDNTEK